MAAKPHRILNTFLFEISKELLEFDHLRGALYFENLVEDLVQMIADLKDIQNECPDPMISVSIVAVQKSMKKLLLNMPVNCVSLEDDFMHHYLYTNISRMIKDPVLLNLAEPTVKVTKSPFGVLTKAEGDSHKMVSFGGLDKHIHEAVDPSAGSPKKRQLTKAGTLAIDASSTKSAHSARQRHNIHVKSITNVYHSALIQYTGRHKIIFVLNLRNRPGFLKGDDIYKLVDDFRKIKYFEIDCAPSSRDFRTAFGGVREMIPCNDRLAAALNGGVMCIQDLDRSTWKKLLDFSTITKPIPLFNRSNSGPVWQPRLDEMSSCVGVTSPQRGLLPDMVPLPGYPKPILTVSDFELLHQLRYSCGWKLDTSSIPSDFPQKGCKNPPEFIRFEYHMFDVHLVQELRRIPSPPAKDSLTTEPNEQKVESTVSYKVTLLQPSLIKDGKHNVYDVIRTELMEWDDILELCNSLLTTSTDEELVSLVRKNTANSASNLLKQVTDQKCTK